MCIHRKGGPLGEPLKYMKVGGKRHILSHILYTHPSPPPPTHTPHPHSVLKSWNCSCRNEKSPYRNHSPTIRDISDHYSWPMSGRQTSPVGLFVLLALGCSLLFWQGHLPRIVPSEAPNIAQARVILCILLPLAVSLIKFPTATPWRRPWRWGLWVAGHT